MKRSGAAHGIAADPGTESGANAVTACFPVKRGRPSPQVVHSRQPVKFQNGHGISFQRRKSQRRSVGLVADVGPDREAVRRKHPHVARLGVERQDDSDRFAHGGRAIGGLNWPRWKNTSRHARTARIEHKQRRTTSTRCAAAIEGTTTDEQTWQDSEKRQDDFLRALAKEGEPGTCRPARS